MVMHVVHSEHSVAMVTMNVHVVCNASSVAMVMFLIQGRSWLGNHF